MSILIGDIKCDGAAFYAMHERLMEYDKKYREALSQSAHYYDIVYKFYSKFYSLEQLATLMRHVEFPMYPDRADQILCEISETGS